MNKTRIGLLVTVFAIGIIVFFAYFSYKKDAITEDNAVATQVQEVLMKDLEKNYPPTPKEVVKFYSEISKCYYNETYTEEELDQMAHKMWSLFDKELQENNPEEQYLYDLKLDIQDFHENNYKISSYSPSSSTDVEYYKDNGRECAKLYCTYTMRNGGAFSTTKEVFILRKDTETEHWKILGFNVAVE